MYVRLKKILFFSCHGTKKLERFKKTCLKKLKVYDLILFHGGNIRRFPYKIFILHFRRFS